MEEREKGREKEEANGRDKKEMKYRKRWKREEESWRVKRALRAGFVVDRDEGVRVQEIGRGRKGGSGGEREGREREHGNRRDRK